MRRLQSKPVKLKQKIKRRVVTFDSNKFKYLFKLTENHHLWFICLHFFFLMVLLMHFK